VRYLGFDTARLYSVLDRHVDLQDAVELAIQRSLRDKLARSMNVALRKRPVEPERIEQVVNSIVRRLESMGETEIKAEVIGGLIMEALHSLDKVAYVRFASVYRNFREAKDFENFITDELSVDDD